mmetsp:Transcript_18338/g.25505  ORF Transcript_18338/g.25505 Transcript_18338/m.25505 type:complete len:101 (+) Transcript_18338:181-483(+)
MIILKILIISQIFSENDKYWIKTNRNGFQNIEIYYFNFHISFNTVNILPSYKTYYCRDSQGLKKFICLIMELKNILISLFKIHLHNDFQNNNLYHTMKIK